VSDCSGLGIGLEVDQIIDDLEEVVDAIGHRRAGLILASYDDGRYRSDT
jgi:hypothetical protein